MVQSVVLLVSGHDGSVRGVTDVIMMVRVVVLLFMMVLIVVLLVSGHDGSGHGVTGHDGSGLGVIDHDGSGRVVTSQDGFGLDLDGLTFTKIKLSKFAQKYIFIQITQFKFKS